MHHQTSHSRLSGVSPVVAVILLVAITVALSAVVGGFALNLGQSSTSGSSTSAGVQTSETTVNGSDAVSITVVTSEGNVSYRVNGSTKSLGGVGETATLVEGEDYAEGDTITVLSDGSVVRSIDTATTDSSTEPVSLPYTQLSDNFSDGDFTNDPSWTESGAASFTVGANNHLRTPKQDGNGTVATTVDFNESGNYTWKIDYRFLTTNKWQQAIVNFASDGTDDNKVRLRMHEAGAFQLGAFENGSKVASTSPGWSADTNWHTVTVKKRGNTWTIFLDGAEKGSITYTLGFDATHHSVESWSWDGSNSGHVYDNVSIVQEK